MSKKIKSKYVSVGKAKIFTIDKNDLFILDALMHDGSQQKYSEVNHKLKYSEHGGLLDFDRYGLERIIISTKKEYDKTRKTMNKDGTPKRKESFTSSMLTTASSAAVVTILLLITYGMLSRRFKP